MTDARGEIREIDLMAYADGLLEGDTARKAAVEAYLDAYPNELSRVSAIMRDNQTIRDLYAAELARPVPQRMLRLVRDRSPVRRNFPASMAASLLIAAVAAGGGWLAAQPDHRAARMSQEELRDVAHSHMRATETASMGGMVSQAVSGAMPPVPSSSIWVELPLPNLAAHGFELVHRGRATVAGKDAVKLVYRSPEATLNLSVRLEETETAGSSAIQRAEIDGLSVYHWSSGAFGYAFTFEGDQEKARPVAEMIKASIEAARFVDPPLIGPTRENETVAEDRLSLPPLPEMQGSLSAQ